MLVTLVLLAAAGVAAFFRPGGPHVASAPPAPFETVSAPAPPRHPAGSSAPNRLVVYVAGEVARPGVYDLPPGSRAEAAVRAAGGVRPDADAVAVNLAARLSDGEEIAIPARGEARPESHHLSRGGRSTRHLRHPRLHGAAQGRRLKAPLEPVDLNAADATTLQTLPGIGPALAERIVEFREANGPFASLDDLLDVAGTSPRLLEEVQPYAIAGAR